jgi:hypothetical protein
MKKHLSIPALMLAAGLVVPFYQGSGDAQEQGSPGAYPGHPSQLDAQPGDAGSAPQGGASTGQDALRDMERERGRFWSEPDARTEQEELGVAPQLEEELPRLENQRQERRGSESGEWLEQEQFGVAPESGDEPAGRFGTRQREQPGLEPEEALEQEQPGVTPESGEGPSGRVGQQERLGSAPGERTDAEQEQFGVAPRFEEGTGAEQGWVRPERKRNGTGWRRKSWVPMRSR